MRIGREAIVIAVMAILAGCALLLVGPRSLGGPTTMITVDGTSMQPHFYTGDLAVFHRQSSYHIGEVAVERVEGSLVVHRLVGGNAQDGWRTKGDKRRDEDTWVVPNKDVLGSEWFLVKDRGPWLTRLTSTGAKIVIIALATVLVLALPSSNGRKKRRAARKAFREIEMPAQLARTSWQPRTPRPWESTALAGTAIVGGFAAAIGVLCLITSARTFGPWSVTTDAIGLLFIAGVLGVLSAILAARVATGWGGSQVDQTVARLRSLLLRVSRLPFAVDVVEIETWNELKAVAVRGASPVLHHVAEQQHEFAVMNQGTCYLLRVPVDQPSEVHDRSDETTAGEHDAAQSRINDELPKAGAAR